MSNALFPLPNEVFQLGLKADDLLVYPCLQYQKGLRGKSVLTGAEMDATTAKVAAFMKKNQVAVDAPSARAGLAQHIASIIDG